MNAVQEVKKVYDIVKAAMPSSIGTQLKYLPPRPMEKKKKGTTLTACGKILGPTKRHIWGNSDCYFEIGIGTYRNQPTHGGNGFVSFPDRPKYGVHKKAISTLLQNYA